MRPVPHRFKADAGGVPNDGAACGKAAALRPPIADSTKVVFVAVLLAGGIPLHPQDLPDSLTLRAWATAQGAADEFSSESYEWTPVCSRDALTGRQGGCMLHSPAYLEVGLDADPGRLGGVALDCNGRVFAQAASGARTMRYVAPSITGNDYGLPPWRTGSLSSVRALEGWLSRQSADHAAAVAESRALADAGYLFTADDSKWAGEIFAFEVEGGAIFRLPLARTDRDRVDAFLAGPYCRHRQESP